MSTPLTPEIREALNATLVIAERNLQVVRAEYELRMSQANEAQEQFYAAQQTVTALNAALEIEPETQDRFKTFGGN